jgi:hypothetical protein
MNQNKIEQFKAILKKWNLRIAENNIADLNDYETEVDDIIFHLEIEYDFQKKVLTKAVV